VQTVVDFVTSLVKDTYVTIRSWSLLKQCAVAAALIAAVLITIFTDVPSLSTLQTWALQAGHWFIAVFTVTYILITQFPIPRTILTLSSGVLFGPWLGIIISLTATTASAALSLSIVRYFLGDWMAPRLRHPAVAKINQRLKSRGWFAITALRMIAGVPFSLLNYAAALTSVPLLGFTIATFIGSAPGTIATVMLGNTLTGTADPKLIMVTLCLAAFGFIGLLVDNKLPVKT
jgi:hypothetical protein